MKNETNVLQKLDKLMQSEIEKCGARTASQCPKIKECWVLENLSLGETLGHIEHRRPLFEIGFICKREMDGTI